MNCYLPFPFHHHGRANQVLITIYGEHPLQTMHTARLWVDACSSARLSPPHYTSYLPSFRHHLLTPNFLLVKFAILSPRHVLVVTL